VQFWSPPIEKSSSGGGCNKNLMLAVREELK